MPDIHIKYFKICGLLVCLFLFDSCQNATEKDSNLLNRDKQSLAELNRVNQIISSGQLITQNEVDSVQKIREKYPSAPVVRQILQSALIRREDWQTAADLISQIPELQRTDEEKNNLAKIYLKLGRYEDVLRIVNPLLEKNPADI
ncbi:MAG: hypothetical protein ABJA66_16370, partial [Actinomycetota bacterium]